MHVEENQNISQFDAWLMAIRPKTLPAAAAPVIIGSTLSYVDHRFDFFPAVSALVIALLLQIGSNVANDLYDYMRGADAGVRLGPKRVTQAGVLSPEHVRRGMFLIFGVALILGVYLVYHAGWPALLIGLTAIISAIAYTGGPFPLSYHGLGDVFVFIYFGLAATAGTYFVQAGTVTSLTWWMASAIGLIIVAILVVNNLRDIESDRLAGKRTLAVRLGVTGTRLEYGLCLLGAYLIPIILWLMNDVSISTFLVFVTIPLAWRCLNAVYKRNGRVLNKTLANTGQLALLYALTFSLGLYLSTLW